MHNENRESILIHPRKGKNERSLPPVGVLLVNPTEAQKSLALMQTNGAQSQFLFNSGLMVSEEEGYFAAGPAIGAPMAALTMEKLIVLGARQIILFGWCGAVDPARRIGDILVPDRAVSGEGTSRYYCSNGVPGPDEKLCRQLIVALAEAELDAYDGCVWSTDALYREDRRVLRSLSDKEKVVAVDMEFSALCAVAAHRKISFAAVLIVSDILSGETWQPGFRVPQFLDNKRAALAVVLSFVARLKEQ